MAVSEELAANALGELALKFVRDIYTSDRFIYVTDGMAVRALQDIQDILNNENLTDFQCVEEIVLIFEHYNLSTSRHDFG